jgi:hypothetical protein
VSFQQEPVFLAAIVALKQTHALDPTDTQILYNLALTLLRTTQPEAAATKFRLLLSLSPDSDNAIKGLELCEQMLMDQTKIKAIKKKREEARMADEASKAASAPPLPTPSAPTPQPNSTTPIKSTVTTSAPVTPIASTTGTVTTPAAATSPPAAAGAPMAAGEMKSSSEPKSESGIRDLMTQIRETSSYFSHDALKAPGPFPDSVNSAHRELYLSEEEFRKLFGSTKEEFLGSPQWKQVSLSFISPQ